MGTFPSYPAALSALLLALILPNLDLLAIGASYLPVGSCVRLDRLTAINANNGLFYGSIGAHLAKIRAILPSPSVNDPATAASIDILPQSSFFPYWTLANY